jgi:EpsI family protein
VRGQVVRINKYAIQNQGFRRLILYWYQSRNRIIASEYLGKVLLVKDTLIEGNTAGAIVRITMPDDPESAEEGPAFASDIVTEVQRCFGVSLPSHLKSASPR